MKNWDESIPNSGFYASTSWLDIAEKTADIAPFYLEGRDASSGALVGTLPCYPMAVASPFPLCRLSHVLGRTVPAYAGEPGAARARDLMPSLLLGGRNPAHATFATVTAGSAAVAGAVAHGLAEAAEEAAAGLGLRTVGMLYVDADDVLTRRVLEARGYCTFAHQEAAVLDVPPDGFEGYLRTVPPRRAREIRREGRLLERAGVRFETVPFDPAVHGDVDRLEANLNRKYGGAFDDDAVRRLRTTMGEVLGDRLRVALARRDGRVIGSVLLVRWRDELYARTAGFDYGAAAGLPLYFGLAFYHLVRYAQETGVRTIRYSTGSEDAKRRRGCRLVCQHAYVKALDGALHRQLAASVP